MKKFILLILLIISSLATAENFSPNPSFSVCFTPGDNCVASLISEISQAKKQILVEAYTFTDFHLAKALVKANKHGVDVKILLDRSQIDNKNFVMDYLQTNNIYLKIDYQPMIAHNKVMIIDSNIVATGSYNYTYRAQEKNAENILIIKDAGVAKHYIANWYARDKASVSIEKYRTLNIKPASFVAH